jgi:hypothetical protein
MKESLSAQPDPQKKPVQNEPTESRDEGMMLPTNYLVVSLVSLVILYLFMNIIATYEDFCVFFYWFLMWYCNTCDEYELIWVLKDIIYLDFTVFVDFISLLRDSYNNVMNVVIFFSFLSNITCDKKTFVMMNSCSEFFYIFGSISPVISVTIFFSFW